MWVGRREQGGEVQALVVILWHDHNVAISGTQLDREDEECPCLPWGNQSDDARSCDLSLQECCHLQQLNLISNMIETRGYFFP